MIGSLIGTRARSQKGLLIAVAAATVEPDGSPVDGRLLVFPVADLPELARGRGNKLFNIPSAKAEARQELMGGLAVVVPGGST